MPGGLGYIYTSAHQAGMLLDLRGTSLGYIYLSEVEAIKIIPVVLDSAIPCP
jgi:hypothetical protein